MVCGHSLGGGVAALLAMHLRAVYGPVGGGTNPLYEPTGGSGTQPVGGGSSSSPPAAGSSRVRCWAYGPPGGLMSPAACLAMHDYCTSVVIGRTWEQGLWWY